MHWSLYLLSIMMIVFNHNGVVRPTHNKKPQQTEVHWGTCNEENDSNYDWLGCAGSFGFAVAAFAKV